MGSFAHDEATNVVSLGHCGLTPVESHLDSFPHLAGGHLHVGVATHPREGWQWLLQTRPSKVKIGKINIW